MKKLILILGFVSMSYAQTDVGTDAARPSRCTPPRNYYATDTNILWTCSTDSLYHTPKAITSGTAGGGLTGTYPNPTLANPNVATGPVVLDGSGNASLPGTLTMGATVSVDPAVGITLTGGKKFIGDGSGLTGISSGLGGTYPVTSYGVVAGDVDTAGANSTAMLALLATVNTAGGGIIYFLPGTYRFDSQLLLPNDGASPQPNQNNIVLRCGGGGGAWYGTNACVLDMRYTAVDGNAKIETRGRGTLVIDGLTIKDDGSTNATPLVHSTNTTLKVRDNTFIGSGNVGQDAIVLGGTATSVGSGVTAPFQGYETEVSGNHFRNLNRGVYGRTFANAVVIQSNSFQGNVGTVAIEFDGTQAIGVGQNNYGNVVSDNNVEMDVYTYFAKLTRTRETLFSGNQLHDPGAGVTAYFNFTNLSTQNTVTCGSSPISKPLLSGDPSDIAATTVMCAEANMLDSTGKGLAASEFAYGAVVKGSYDSTKSYPGPLTVSDQNTPNERVSIGYDHANARGIVDCKNNITATPCSILGSALQVPNIAGASSAVAGGITFDTTNKNLHSGANSVDNIVPLVVASAPLVDTNYVKASVSGGLVRLVDGGSSAGNPTNYYTSSASAGVGGTSFTPAHTFHVYGTTSTNFFVQRGNSQSGDVANVNFGASANDLHGTSSTGTVYGRTNAGFKWQLVTADGAESLRLMSTALLGFNSTADLGGGAIDTGLSRCAAGALCVGTGAQGSMAGTVQAGVTATDPGCTTTGHVGKQWFDITTTTTVYKVCLNVAGTLTWVTK